MRNNLSKYCLLLLAFFITLNFQSYSQENSKNDLKSKIDKIKSQYKAIKSIESSLKEKNITLDNEEGESSLKILSLKNESKEIIYRITSGDCGDAYEVYYFQNKPFFVLYSSECFVYEKTTKTEQRYYLDNGQLIQYIEGKKTIKENSEEFKQAQESITYQLKEISDLIK